MNYQRATLAHPDRWCIGVAADHRAQAVRYTGTIVHVRPSKETLRCGCMKVYVRHDDALPIFAERGDRLPGEACLALCQIVTD